MQSIARALQGLLVLSAMRRRQRPARRTLKSLSRCLRPSLARDRKGGNHMCSAAQTFWHVPDAELTSVNRCWIGLTYSQKQCCRHCSTCDRLLLLLPASIWQPQFLMVKAHAYRNTSFFVIRLSSAETS